jgi:hypothetical protein
MKNLLQRNLANGFPDFPGLTLSGKIPIREELINQLIDDFLRKNAESTEPAQPQKRDNGISMSNILKLVRKATIHAEAGVVTLEVELRS